MAKKIQPTMLYKDMSYSQLRSYCETARLGNMSAAARSLELSHPTVWKQIRALEKMLGQTLVESDGRRSELTEEGLLFAKLASPIVAEFESLQEHFHQACGAAPKKLTVAAPPRSFTDDLVPVIDQFRKRYPDVHLIMQETIEFQGHQMLEMGEIDLVIGNRRCCQWSEELIIEPIYEIEPMVIMPVGHPLSKRRRIMPKDLAKYPVLNHPDSYPDDEVSAALKNAGVFNNRSDRKYSLFLAASIRNCVKLGYGIGLVGRSSIGHTHDPEICERSLKHCLRPITCFGFSFRRLTENPTQRIFIDLVKEMVNG